MLASLDRRTETFAGRHRELALPARCTARTVAALTSFARLAASIARDGTGESDVAAHPAARARSARRFPRAALEVQANLARGAYVG